MFYEHRFFKVQQLLDRCSPRRRRLFVGFPEEAATSGIEYLFAFLASGKALREYFKRKPEVDAGAAVNNSNWWNYIATIAVAIGPNIPLELFDSLQDAAVAAISSNWQGILVALFSIATIIYNLVQSKKKVPEEAPA